VSAPRTRIKICGIMQADHAMAAAQAGADAIGFVFWSGTPRMVSAERAAAIAATLPPFVSIVGLFVDPTPEHVHATLARVPLDVLQFHGDETPELCRAFGRAYMKAIAVEPGATETALLEYAGRFGDAAALLFDAPAVGGVPGGTGQTFDWSALARMRARFDRRIVLSGGLHAGGEAAGPLRPGAIARIAKGGQAAGFVRSGTADPSSATMVGRARNPPGALPPCLNGSRYRLESSPGSRSSPGFSSSRSCPICGRAAARAGLPTPPAQWARPRSSSVSRIRMTERA